MLPYCHNRMVVVARLIAPPQTLNSLFILDLSPPSFQYSLDNEAERQRLEQEAERLRGGGLGGQRRAQHVEALRRIEAELEGANHATSPLSAMVNMRPNPPPPRSSANLEQLYHEALPSPPILSNSGPPNLVYSSASNLFYQVRAKRRENSSICPVSRGMAKQREFCLTSSIQCEAQPWPCLGGESLHCC